jgi:hypothetical protein
MNFIEVVKAMKEGRKVRQSRWMAKYMYFKKGVLYVVDSDGSENCKILYMCDAEATDWEIVEDDWSLIDNAGFLYNIKNETYVDIRVYTKEDIETLKQKIEIDLENLFNGKTELVHIDDVHKILTKRIGF